MFTAGLLRVASRLALLLMIGAIFMGITIQKEASVFWYITAVVFFGIAIFAGNKAKEQNIKAKVQIEEKERARIQAKQR